MSLLPIKIDCQNIRTQRQKLNNLLVFNSIKDKDIKSFYKNVNEKEFKRVLEENEITEEELLEECRQKELLNKILSGRISKNSSRQGTKDENLQLFTCNILSNKLGIKIENLSVNEYRPDCQGNIVYNSKIPNLMEK